MKTSLIALLLAASAAGAVHAQTAPVGGPDAKGNAPIKRAHTVNDGSAKPGANSFTRGEAMRHIMHSGYTNVTGLTKGKDGVWRGSAMKGGATVSVAMDFKGNVSQGMGPVAAPAAPAAPMAPMSPPPATTSSTEPTTTRHVMHSHHRRPHHHHRYHHGNQGCSTNPGPNGVACSGRDRNRNGISDKEDRAIGAGAKP